MSLPRYFLIARKKRKSSKKKKPMCLWIMPLMGKPWIPPYTMADSTVPPIAWIRQYVMANPHYSQEHHDGCYLFGISKSKAKRQKQNLS